MTVIIRYSITIYLVSLTCCTSSYQPNLAVRAAHAIPHLSRGFQSQSNTFTVSRNYFESILFLPILCCIVCFAMLLLYLFSMCFRCCFECIRCRPKDIASSPDIAQYSYNQYEKWRNNVLQSYHIITVIFASVMVLLFLADHVVFYSDSSITKGVDRVTDALVTLSNTFNTLTSLCNSIVSDANTMVSLLSQSTCIYLSYYDINSYLDYLDNAMSTIVNYIENISDYLINARDYILRYGVSAKNLVSYITYSVIFVISILFSLGAILRNGIMAKVAISISIPVIAILAIICTVEMIFIVSLPIRQ